MEGQSSTTDHEGSKTQDQSLENNQQQPYQQQGQGQPQNRDQHSQQQEHEHEQRDSGLQHIGDDDDLEETSLLKEINSALAQQAESETMTSENQTSHSEEAHNTGSLSATSTSSGDPKNESATTDSSSSSKSYEAELTTNAKRSAEVSHYDVSDSSQPKRKAVENNDTNLSNNDDTSNSNKNNTSNNGNDQLSIISSDNKDSSAEASHHHEHHQKSSLSSHKPLDHEVSNTNTNNSNANSVYSNDDSFSKALMELSDTEQLEFLAQQLKFTDTSMATTQPASQNRQSQLRSGSSGNDSGGSHQSHMGSNNAFSSFSQSQRNDSPPFDKQQHQRSDSSSHFRSRPESPLYQDVGQSNRYSDSGSYQDTSNDRPGHQNSSYLESFIGDPITNLRVRSIPILDNLATQILNTLTKPGHLDSLGIATSPETAEGQAFQVLTSLFTQTKTIYSDSEFVNAESIGLYNDPYCRQIIQKANLATFVAALFGVYPMSFYLLDYHFLDVFVHPGSRLLKLQAALYLDLKTQAYIVTVQQRDDPKEMVLNNTFPEDIEQALLARKNTKVLVPSEADFVQRVKRRKEHLAALPDDVDLSQKYQWLTFLKDIADYVNKNLSVILTGRAQSKTAPSNGSKNNAGRPVKKKIGTSIKGIDDGGMAQQNQQHSSNTAYDGTKSTTNLNKSLGLTATSGNGEYTGSETDYDSTNASSMGANEDGNNSNNLLLGNNGGSYNSNGIVSSVSDSVQQTPVPASSIVSASNTTTTTRTGFFQRRTWTAEEEAALLEGLNIVNGPYWSKILDMYGPGGTVSEVLKDRNQVQLKDKARNLKLYYLKANIPMPEVLQNVTGHTNRGERSKRGKRGGGRGGARGGARAAAIPRNTNTLASSASSQGNNSMVSDNQQLQMQRNLNMQQQQQQQQHQHSMSNQAGLASQKEQFNPAGSQLQSFGLSSSQAHHTLPDSTSQRLHQPQHHSPLSTLSFVASNQLESSKTKSNTSPTATPAATNNTTGSSTSSTINTTATSQPVHSTHSTSSTAPHPKESLPAVSHTQSSSTLSATSNPHTASNTSHAPDSNQASSSTSADRRNYMPEFNEHSDNNSQYSTSARGSQPAKPSSSTDTVAATPKNTNQASAPSKPSPRSSSSSSSPTTNTETQKSTTSTAASEAKANRFEDNNSSNTNTQSTSFGATNSSNTATEGNNNSNEDATMSIDSLMQEVGAYISNEEKRVSSESPVNESTKTQNFGNKSATQTSKDDSSSNSLKRNDLEVGKKNVSGGDGDESEAKLKETEKSNTQAMEGEAKKNGEQADKPETSNDKAEKKDEDGPNNSGEKIGKDCTEEKDSSSNKKDSATDGANNKPCDKSTGDDSKSLDAASEKDKESDNKHGYLSAFVKREASPDIIPSTEHAEVSTVNNDNTNDVNMDAEDETELQNEAERLLQNLMDQEKMDVDISESGINSNHQSAGTSLQENETQSSKSDTATGANNTTTTAPQKPATTSATSETDSTKTHTENDETDADVGRGGGVEEEDDEEICMDVLEDLVKTVKGLEEEEAQGNESHNPDTESEVSKAMREVEEAIRREESS